jgi:hypothetical protein
VARLGVVGPTPPHTSPSGGRPSTEYLLNEGQSLLICALSETPRAADARETLIKSFMQVRRGGQKSVAIEPDEMLDAIRTLPVADTRMAVVREARLLWGPERARLVWQNIGLPVPPIDQSCGTGEARDCVEQLLLGSLEGKPVRHWMDMALDGDIGPADILKAIGIWPEPDSDGFVVANRSPAIENIMKGTAWDKARWQPVLRRLPGTSVVKPRRFSQAIIARGVFVPAAYMGQNGLIDDDSLPASLVLPG